MTAVLVPLLSSLGPWAVALLAGVIFAETGLLAFVLPGDSLLFAGGLLIGVGHLPVPLAVVAGACALSAVVGDQVAFHVGRRLGPRLSRPPRRRLTQLLWSPRHLDAAVAFFARHGGRAVVLARFVPLVRTFTPVVAGAAGMSSRTFTSFNAVGGIAWTTSMLIAGRALGDVPAVAHHVELITVALVALSLLPVALGWLRSRARRGETGSARRAVDSDVVAQQHRPT